MEWLVKRCEPPRDCRRPFRLSQAAIAEWGEVDLDFLQTMLPCHHGISGGSWLTIMMYRINPALFAACFTGWVRARWRLCPTKWCSSAVAQALAEVNTSAATMSRVRTHDRIFDIVRASVDEVVLVEDDEMNEAAAWLWFEMGLAADPSGAAAIAALRERRIPVRSGERICAIICGAGPDAVAG